MIFCENAPVSTLLSINVVHGLIALLWAMGVRRLLAPGSSVFATSLLAICLTMPVAVGVLGALVRLWRPEAAGEAALLRVGAVAATLQASAPPVMALIWTLLAGTMVLFIAQELVGVLSGLDRTRGVLRSPDPALDAMVSRLAEGFRAADPRRPARPVPEIARLETDRPVALLAGLRRPIVLISRGLIAGLDAEQLEAVVAHELAHAALGGNRRLLLLWFMRSIQAASPAALIMFRTLTANLEAACDTVAARMTGRPAVLASALLQVHTLRRGAGPREALSAGLQADDAVSTTAARGDEALLRLRVRALLAAPTAPAPRGTLLAAALLLGALLWGVR